MRRADQFGQLPELSFADARRRVADMMDQTVEAALPKLPVKRLPSNAAVCREAYGHGEATGDYKPVGRLALQLPEGIDGRSVVECVRRYWEEQGYRVDGENMHTDDPTVYAEVGNDFGMSFEVIGTKNLAVMHGSGPCLKPGSDGERDLLPEFRSVSFQGSDGGE